MNKYFELLKIWPELAGVRTCMVNGVTCFTGCDVVSAFHERGKKTACETWDVCPEASDIFAKLCQYPPAVGNEDLKVLSL